MEKQTTGYNLSISINDIQLSYDDVGAGAIPIIFLHGYPFDKTMWQGQLDFLVTTNRVIAYDIRGFGKSKDETASLSIDLFVADLQAFMDKLNIERAIICGLSMGGYIALNAVKKFPERFEALILCDTQCIADPIEVKQKRYETIAKIEAEGVTNFNEGFIKGVFHKNSIANKKELVEQLSEVVYANSKHIMKQGLTAIAERSETCSSLNEIKIPVLVICGREDSLTPVVQSEFMHKTINGSKLVIIDEAAHVSNLEQPQVFNKNLDAFVTALRSVEVGKI